MSAKQTSPSVFEGELPKIGIRPTIDGRLGGVRESLEEQTMNLGKRVAELISSNLNYPNGQPVQCALPDVVLVVLQRPMHVMTFSVVKTLA